MKCQFCQNHDATVHLTQILSGQMQKVDLCEKCAKEKGVADPTGFSLADMLLGLSTPNKDEADETVVERACPSCGFTQSDFRKTGRLGCPKCYDTFSDHLSNLLKDMHKGTNHQGKVPARYAQRQRATEHLRELQRNLQEAVRDERYEDAAKLRDQITRLEGELKAEHSSRP